MKSCSVALSWFVAITPLGSYGADKVAILAECQIEAVRIAGFTDSRPERRKTNWFIENCMAAAGYIWNESTTCDADLFRSKWGLSSDPSQAASCFVLRSPSAPQ
jgi:hypothetical protein